MTAQYGPYSPIHEYLPKIKGNWRALPSSTGTLNLNCCARISLLKQHAGIDIVAMYLPHKSDPAAAANWTYDTFLMAAEACQKAGFAFGLGLGQPAVQRSLSRNHDAACRAGEVFAIGHFSGRARCASRQVWMSIAPSK
jgi:hypothetical protein